MKKAYVTIQSGHRLLSLNVINVRTNQVISVTPFGELGLERMAGKPLPKSDGVVYVLSNSFINGRQPVFYVLNTNTRRVIKTIPLGKGAKVEDYILTPNQNRVWFTDSASSSVKVISTHTNKIIHDIAVPSPVFLAATPNGKFVWVMSKQGKIFIIRTRTKKIVGSFQVPFGPFVFSPDGKSAYLGRTDRSTIQILVIDVQKEMIVRKIITDTDDHIQGKMYITPNGKRLVVVVRGNTAIINPFGSIVALRDFFPNDVHGFQIFSITRNGIVIRNVNTLNVIKTVPVKHASAVAVTGI